MSHYIKRPDGTIPLCTTCKYCSKKVEHNSDTWLCGHPNNVVANSPISMVDGSSHLHIPFCISHRTPDTEERQNFGLSICGYEGAWWELKQNFNMPAPPQALAKPPKPRGISVDDL